MAVLEFKNRKEDRIDSWLSAGKKATALLLHLKTSVLSECI